MHPLSLAPATVGELGPVDVVECAAAAGFASTGVRPPDPARDAPAVAAALRRTGVALLDLEYVRIAPRSPTGSPLTGSPLTGSPLSGSPLTDDQLATADAAAELGARFLLVVSDDPDPGATAAALAALRDRLAGSPTAVALEFMAFTAVRRLADAVDLARRVPGVRVLLDPLHLARGGDPADAPAAVEPALLGYGQLCDAGPPPTGPDRTAALAQEARHDRLPPGHGELPLAAFLGSLPPDLPLSVEVHSDRLRAQLDPVARARLIHDAARTLLDPTPEA